MGAGKSTVGKEVARLTERLFVDLDEEIERRHGPIPRLFEERGQPEFRRLEEELAAEVLRLEEPAVIALGGGAVLSEATRRRLRRRAFTVWIDVDLEEAWRRVRGSDRPLAGDETEFRRRFRERLPLYEETADDVASDVDGVLLASLRIVVGRGVFPNLLGYVERRPIAVIGDERVLALHPPNVPDTLASRHSVPSGEEAKRPAVAERLWNELSLDRGGAIVALGGGATTDVAGFVAATYLRGVSWVAVPTTLVGQADAAIGGKTAIDLVQGKNLVGAFHYPDRVVIDPDALATLPEPERRNGLAEVVKTGLLAGRRLWELPDDEMVRACAAFKAAVCLSDPFEQGGRRVVLNLGHTFAHALEAASAHAVPHGRAVALGLLAALRLSGVPTDVVEEALSPTPVRVDPEAAWAALARDKKARKGRTRLVLLEGFGRPLFPVELPDHDVRRALESLIAH